MPRTCGETEAGRQFDRRRPEGADRARCRLGSVDGDRLRPVVGRGEHRASDAQDVRERSGKQGDPVDAERGDAGEHPGRERAGEHLALQRVAVDQEGREQPLEVLDADAVVGAHRNARQARPSRRGRRRSSPSRSRPRARRQPPLTTIRTEPCESRRTASTHSRTPVPVSWVASVSTTVLRAITPPARSCEPPPQPPTAIPSATATATGTKRIPPVGTRRRYRRASHPCGFAHQDQGQP